MNPPQTVTKTEEESTMEIYGINADTETKEKSRNYRIGPYKTHKERLTKNRHFFKERSKKVCDKCFDRMGVLVLQYLHPGHSPSVEPFVFRFYACSICRAAHNRKYKTKWNPTCYLPDDQVTELQNL